MSIKKSTTTTGVLCLLFVNLILFALLNTYPSSRELLLFDPTLESMIQRPWTIVSVYFSHELLIHLVSNMMLLLYFGTQLEKLVGAKSVVFIYLVSGLIGSLTMPIVASFIEWEGLVMGASGACFGVVGAFAALRPYHKFIQGNSKIFNALMGGNALTFAVLMFGMNAFIAITNPSVSIGAAAHGLGLIFGGGVGLWLKHREKTLASQLADMVEFI